MCKADRSSEGESDELYSKQRGAGKVFEGAKSDGHSPRQRNDQRTGPRGSNVPAGFEALQESQSACQGVAVEGMKGWEEGMARVG